MRPSTLKRVLRLPRFEEHLELPRLDCQAGGGRFANYDFARQKLAEIPAGALRPPPLVNGRDLIAAGLEPGPEFTRILRAVEDAQLEGRVTTKEEALAWALSRPSGP
jgi:poly(A) polymerase